MFEVVFEAGKGIGERISQLLEPRLVGRDILRAILRALHRQDVLRRPHENLQLPDLAGDGLDDLDTRRADPDDADPLAGQIHRLLRPTGRME